jgi:DNA-binding PucR family transcriptional regulator
MTLRTYFECGHNAAAAAERLSLNDRTVAYRLRTIEERMARPVVARRDELSIALRLLDYYTVA